MDIEKRVSKAIHHFWKTRKNQRESQGKKTGIKDHGKRGEVTGGKQLDGFIELFHDILVGAGLPETSIHAQAKTLPGYFRPTKDWDLVVVVDGQLFASIEFKSHIGPSFGNNFNNRIEEALGSATDLRKAYSEGMFPLSLKPWLGWLMLLEDVDKAVYPSSYKYPEPHFPVRDEFKEFENNRKYMSISYARRYEIFCERLLREQLYDSACLILANETQGLKGAYREPNPEISFRRFTESLEAKAIAYAKRKK